MKTKIFIISVLALFVLVISFGDVFSAQGQPRSKVVIPSDRNYQPDCEAINPDLPYEEYVIQHDWHGTTWYDEQQIGSMGRMISADPAGNRHMVFQRSDAAFPPGPRYTCYNCKDPWDTWCCAPEAFDGTCNAGYANVDQLRDSRALLLYHHTAPCETGDPIWYTTLRVQAEGDVCTPYFSEPYDLPDYFSGRTEQGIWPKMCVVPVGDIDYMHIVMTEGKTSGGNQYLGYIRCYLDGLATNSNLICQTPKIYGNPQGVVSPVTVIAGADGCGSFCPIAYFGRCTDPDCGTDDYPNTISVIAVSSPVSRKVAIVFINKKEGGENRFNNDIFYFESANNGIEWFPQFGGGGCWPPEDCGMLVNVTEYPDDYPERAYTDLAACYDYEDNLHIVWNSCSYDSSTGNPPSFYARLMHWVNTDPPGINNAIVVASGYPEGFEFSGKTVVYPWWLWPDIKPGEWNRTVCKPSIAAMEPEYHPDSVYLFCTWTQFDPGDTSVKGYGNGDIYGAVSGDGGQCWFSYNLTNTKTPNCDPDNDYPCLNEHWSSMMVADSTLHISYVCDHDAGAAVQYEGEWTENDMMYLHLKELPYPETCAVSIKLTDPPTSWCYPPLKVVPGETRSISMKLKGLYTVGGTYSVTTNNANVVCITNCAGFLAPQEEVTVDLQINCPGGESFIPAKVFVDYCGGTEDERRDTVNLHVVQSRDYYECPRDTLRTTIWKDNCKLRAWFCVNCEQRVWDKRVLDPDDEEIQPIFSAAPIVATTFQGDTVVGRQDWSDILTGARDTIHHVVGIDPFEPMCSLQVVWSENTFICAWPLPIPNHYRWWWIDIQKQIFMWHDSLPGVVECPNWKKEQIIKQIWITKSLYPWWWPSPGAQEYEDIWFGYFADIDAPWDKGGIGYNYTGYDAAREMVWFHGWYNDTLPVEEQHPEYEDYYVGLTFTDRDGDVVAPLGVQVVRNDSFLYPNDGWGWKEQELYDLAATAGVNFQDPDSIVDRSVVMTASHVPGGTGNFSSEYILIEAFIDARDTPGQGLAQLQQHIDNTRDILIPELKELEVFKVCPICGDCNEDGVVSSADIVCKINYLFKGGPEPSWPITRADSNGDGSISSADIVYEINFLFKGGPAGKCAGFGR